MVNWHSLDKSVGKTNNKVSKKQIPANHVSQSVIFLVHGEDSSVGYFRILLDNDSSKKNRLNLAIRKHESNQHFTFSLLQREETIRMTVVRSFFNIRQNNNTTCVISKVWQASARNRVAFFLNGDTQYYYFLKLLPAKN